MTDTKWTPGPWAIAPNGGHWIYAPEANRTGDIICDRPDEEESGKFWTANASLIAAAPRLYDAALLAVESCPACLGRLAAAQDQGTVAEPCDSPACRVLRGALSCARGES